MEEYKDAVQNKCAGYAEEACSSYMKGDMKGKNEAIDKLRALNPEAAEAMEKMIHCMADAEK